MSERAKNASSRVVGQIEVLADRPVPRPGGGQRKKSAGDGQILLEVEQLIAIGKLPVEKQCGERAERGERDRRKARCQPGGDQQAAAELQEDDRWEQRRR
jgi:hypothetical protein